MFDFYAVTVAQIARHLCNKLRELDRAPNGLLLLRRLHIGIYEKPLSGISCWQISDFPLFAAVSINEMPIPTDAFVFLSTPLNISLVMETCEGENVFFPQKEIESELTRSFRRFEKQIIRSYICEIKGLPKERTAV